MPAICTGQPWNQISAVVRDSRGWSSKRSMRSFLLCLATSLQPPRITFPVFHINSLLKAGFKKKINIISVTIGLGNIFNSVTKWGMVVASVPLLVFSGNLLNRFCSRYWNFIHVKQEEEISPWLQHWRLSLTMYFYFNVLGFFVIVLGVFSASVSA